MKRIHCLNLLQPLFERFFVPFCMKLVRISVQRQNLLISPRSSSRILLSWGDFIYIDRLRKPIPCNFLEKMSKRQPRCLHKSQNDDIFSFIWPKMAKILLLICKVVTFQNSLVIVFMQMKMLYELRMKIKWFIIKFIFISRNYANYGYLERGVKNWEIKVAFLFIFESKM